MSKPATALEVILGLPANDANWVPDPEAGILRVRLLHQTAPTRPNNLVLNNRCWQN